eukprot:scaffold14426_cov15-Tisochrysis_lutea.AAC.1
MLDLGWWRAAIKVTPCTKEENPKTRWKGNLRVRVRARPGKRLLLMRVMTRVTMLVLGWWGVAIKVTSCTKEEDGVAMHRDSMEIKGGHNCNAMHAFKGVGRLKMVRVLPSKQV